MIADVVAIGLLVVGLLFVAVAAIGFVRLPDVYCRLHVTGVLDTLGAPVILLAAAVHVGFSLTAGKLLLAIVFLYVTAPLVGHLLAQAAVEAGHEPELEATEDAHGARHYEAGALEAEAKAAEERRMATASQRGVGSAEGGAG